MTQPTPLPTPSLKYQLIQVTTKDETHRMDSSFKVLPEHIKGEMEITLCNHRGEVDPDFKPLKVTVGKVVKAKPAKPSKPAEPSKPAKPEGDTTKE